MLSNVDTPDFFGCMVTSRSMTRFGRRKTTRHRICLLFFSAAFGGWRFAHRVGRLCADRSGWPSTERAKTSQEAELFDRLHFIPSTTGLSTEPKQAGKTGDGPTITWCIDRLKETRLRLVRARCRFDFAQLGVTTATEQSKLYSKYLTVGRHLDGSRLS